MERKADNNMTATKFDKIQIYLAAISKSCTVSSFFNIDHREQAICYIKTKAD